MTERYNGWTNYETWNVALWLSNDEGSQNYWQKQTRNSERIESLAQQLKQEIEDNSPLAEECSLYSDILSANLSEVNYYEIAQNWREDGDISA